MEATYIPTEEIKSDRTDTSAVFYFVVLWFAFGAITGQAASFEPIMSGAYYLVAVTLWSVFHTIIHELAHAIVGTKAGFEVHRITIGRGKRLLTVKLFGFSFEFNRFITRGGITYLTCSKLKNYHRRKFLMVAAGPVIDIVLIFLLLPFSGDGYTFSNLSNIFHGPQHIACAFIVLQLYSLFIGLIPWNPSISDSLNTLTSSKSDGNQLFSILFGKAHRNSFYETQSSISKFLKELDTGEDIPELLLGGRPELSFAFNQYAILVQRSDIPNAIAILNWLTEQPETLIAEKIFLYDILASMPAHNNAAWAYRKDALEKWLPTAVQLANDRESQTLSTTKGILLVLNDQYSEAEKILIPVASQSKKNNDRLGARCYMAVSKCWQGDSKSAHSWIEKAKEHQDNNPSLNIALIYMNTPPETDDSVIRSKLKCPPLETLRKEA